MPQRVLNRALEAVVQPGGLINGNIRIGARRTSLRLDRLTWQASYEIAARERITVHELCTAIHSEKPHALSLTAAIRLAVLQYYRDAATEAGHATAGHGTTVH
jgi:predicted DNA-binding ribbon-helix-helix protein